MGESTPGSKPSAAPGSMPSAAGASTRSSGTASSGTATPGTAVGSAGLVDLHPSLLPLAFLVGTWRGEGVGGYTGIESFRYGQEITFFSSGQPSLSYVSRTWWIGPSDGGTAAPDSPPQRAQNSPLASEVGFWRVAERPDGISVAEVTLAHPFGIAEVYVGPITGTKIELEENVVIRTTTARAVERSVRLYGLVEGDLAYAIDMEAEGEPLQPHLSARLRRAPGGVGGSA